jgi:predicted metalloendopeptidase
VEDEVAYRQRLVKLVEQFGAFSPIEGARVNGTLTLGENAGDLAGLAVAHRAYQLALGGRPAPAIDGLTGDQRFFMGWAQIWRAKERDEFIRQTLLRSAYAPARFRANGPVSHVPAFYEAFGLKEGDRLYKPPDDRVRIW